MANFTYANSAVVSRMYAHLQNTSFPGISVSSYLVMPQVCISYVIKLTMSPFLQGSEVRFNDQGTRDLDKVLIHQYHWQCNGMIIY